MVCYAVPTVAVIIHGIIRKKNVNWKNNVHHLWLSLIFAGAAIFGLIDHWWNGELFMIGENLYFDLLLGITITIGCVIIWGVLTTLDKSKVKTEA